MGITMSRWGVMAPRRNDSSELHRVTPAPASRTMSEYKKAAARVGVGGSPVRAASVRRCHIVRHLGPVAHTQIAEIALRHRCETPVVEPNVYAVDGFRAAVGPPFELVARHTARDDTADSRDRATGAAADLVAQHTAGHAADHCTEHTGAARLLRDRFDRFDAAIEDGPRWRLRNARGKRCSRRRRCTRRQYDHTRSNATQSLAVHRRFSSLETKDLGWHDLSRRPSTIIGDA